MSPVTHLLISWSFANICDFNKRERMLVTVSGVIPDIDGLGIIADQFTRNTSYALDWWERFHHVLGHNLGFCLAVTIAVFSFSNQRIRAGGMAFLIFHLHLFCDLIGARGPEGYQWPISYLLPFSDKWLWVWEGQWALNALPNFIITGICLFFTFYIAWKRGFSPLEMISVKADQRFVETLRMRFRRE